MARPRALTVALIGVDGSGKSTLAERLAAALPGGNLVKIRSGRSGLERVAADAGLDDLGQFVGWNEAMLMMGTVAWQSMKDVKALRRDPATTVILDRCHFCVLALAGIHSPQSSITLRTLFAGIKAPDLTLHVRVDPAVAIARLHQRGGSDKHAEFLAAFDAAYAALPEAAAFAPIDGNRTQDEMFTEAMTTLARHQ